MQLTNNPCCRASPNICCVTNWHEHVAVDVRRKSPHVGMRALLNLAPKQPGSIGNNGNNAIPIHEITSCFQWHAHVMPTYCLHNVYILPAHCLHTACTLPTYCLYIAYILLAHCLHTACTLPTYCLHTAYILPVHCLHTACTLPTYRAHHVGSVSEQQLDNSSVACSCG